MKTNTAQIPLNSIKRIPNKESRFSQYKKCKYFFIMLLPVYLYYIIFHYAPMYGITIAFKEYNFVQGVFASPWVGFKYFNEVFSNIFFLSTLRNTLIISFYKFIFGFPAPIILALLINEVRNGYFKKVVQSVTYLPHFISWVVLSGMVIEILSPSRGPINFLIQSLGMKPIFFMGDPNWFRTILVSSSIWREIGWSSIIFLAAITNVDPELYDVADLDGAGRLRKIWNVTLPSISPVIIIMLIFATGSIINDDFDQIFNFMVNNDAIKGVGDVISTYAYREGLQRMNYSYSTAVGLFKNVISFTLVMIANQIARKKSDYSIW